MRDPFVAAREEEPRGHHRHGNAGLLEQRPQRGRDVVGREDAHVEGHLPEEDGGALEAFSLAKGPTGVVVLSRPWWPGWQAWDGDRPLPVLRAAGVRLAVVVDRPSRVSVVYVPPLLEAGLVVGVLGWIAVGLLWWWPAWTRRKRHPEAS